MRMRIGLLSIVGFFGLLAAVNAQTRSASTAGTAFDGTYNFVSSAKVNPMYTALNGRMAPCPDRTPGPLTIQNGHARYAAETGHVLLGTIGPNGELDMRMVPTTVGGSRPMEMRSEAAGIDSAGTVSLRQIGGACSYDFVWQKQ
jgi:hypothetical protein